MDLSIIPECYVDTNLIETLCPPEHRYNHQKGCGTVAKVMKEKFKDRFALGIIDKDKHEIDYLKEFESKKELEGIVLHKHKSKPHYIIQIKPAMEKFILSNAEASGVALSDFDLPEDFKSLKKESKTVISKNDGRFKKLFKKILENEESEFVRLKEIIDILKNDPYSDHFQ